jgi:hypothetical protein
MRRWVVFLLCAGVANACSLSVTGSGARGDGRALDTAAIQKSIDTCARLGGGEVRFPAGVYRSGTLHLRSHVALRLEAGAVLRGSTELDDYLEPLARRVGDQSHFVSWTGSRRLFLYGDHVTDVAIRGNGTIDGNRVREADHARGPLNVFFQHSEGITLEGVTVENSPGWSVTFFDCRRVRVLGVKLKRVMADGINPVSCQDVLLDGVEMDGTGDDPVCIKNEGPPLAGGYVTRDIVVRRTRVRNTSHPAVKIGTGTFGTFAGILVEDCTFEHTGDLFAIQLMRPSWPGERARYIRDVTLGRGRARDVGRLLDVTAMGVERPVIGGLLLEDLDVETRQGGGRILGTALSPMEGVRLRNVRVRSAGAAGAWLQTRRLSGLRLENVRVEAPGAAGLLDAEAGSGFELEGVEAAGLAAAGPVVRLHEMRDVRVGRMETPRVETLVAVSGAGTEGIRVEEVKREQAGAAMAASAEVPAGALEPSAAVAVTGFTPPAKVRPNETIRMEAQVRNSGRAGAALVTVTRDGREFARAWRWMEAGATAAVTVEGGPLYEPGRYRLESGGRRRTLRVVKTPADVRYGEYCEMETPAAAGATTRVAVKVRNLGGTAGSQRVELKAGGTTVASQTVELQPGEEKRVTMEHVFAEGGRHELQVADFPVWRYATFRNVAGRFLLYRDRMAMEAGGRPEERNDYAAIYVTGVRGNFDAVMRLRAHSEHTGTSAAVGLMLRDRIADTSSGGWVVHYRVPRYGGYKIWEGDTDGDGVLDVRGDGGDARVPAWYKLEKRGTRVTVYNSQDGKNWRLAGGYGVREYVNPKLEPVQEVGLYGTAWSDRGELSRMEFSDFEVRAAP